MTHSSKNASPALSAGPTVHSGTCLCKQVAYTLTADRPLEVRVCHCVNCKKATGSAFMVNSFWLEKTFKITKGGELLKAFRDEDTASGFAIQRWFCIHCGSNVYMRSTHPKTRIVVVGLGGFDAGLDAVDHATSQGCVKWQPDFEWFPEQRFPWIEKIQVKDEKKNISRVKPKL